MVTLEIDLRAIADEMESPLHTFREEMKEFFELYGWEVIRVANYEDEE